jgi:hypothetical protein
MWAQKCMLLCAQIAIERILKLVSWVRTLMNAILKSCLSTLRDENVRIRHADDDPVHGGLG